jgi:hypothetical protein
VHLKPQRNVNTCILARADTCFADLTQKLRGGREFTTARLLINGFFYTEVQVPRSYMDATLIEELRYTSRNYMLYIGLC